LPERGIRTGGFTSSWGKTKIDLRYARLAMPLAASSTTSRFRPDSGAAAAAPTVARWSRPGVAAAARMAATTLV